VPCHVPSVCSLCVFTVLRWLPGPCVLALGSADQYTELMADRSDASLIRADFDRLAAFSTDEWDHSSLHAMHFG